SQGASRKSSRTSSYNTFKILTDERSNSAIIFGPPRTINDIRNLEKKFDIPLEDPTAQASIHVRPLDYADAKKLATTLSSLTGASGRPQSAIRRPPIRRSPTSPNTTPGTTSVA